MAKSKINGTTGTAEKKSTGTLKKTVSKAPKKGQQQTLGNLFEEGLKDIYNAEKQLIEALPKMAEAAYSQDLENAFTEHLQQTERQAERLEKIFEWLEIENKEKECKAMKGLIKEGNEIIEEFEEGPVRDAALIIGAQKIEHYEIAAYGSLCELADVLGYSRISEVLDYSLEEEEVTDENLTCIAQDVNDEAYELTEEEEREEVY
jgi:ferritin-like metal-binding protein YciE